MTNSARHRMTHAFAASVALGILTLTGTLGASIAAADPDTHRPPTDYVVSDDAGFLPEGITITPGGRMYVGSDGTGAINSGTVRQPNLTAWLGPADTGRATTLGVHTDRAGRVYSVGADTVTVHRPDGRTISRVSVSGGPLGAARLNDLAVTDRWLYVTDFANPIVYRMPRDATGRLGTPQAWLDMRTVWPGFPAQYWFLNGIVASPDGSTLLVASNGTETTWRVTTATGTVTPLDIDTPSFGPDGMVVRGSTLYAVLNYGAPDGVYVAVLNRDWTSARLAQTVTTAADGSPFDTPTTLAVHHCRLFVVNSQNRHAPGTPPYLVSTVADPTCEAPHHSR